MGTLSLKDGGGRFLGRFPRLAEAQGWREESSWLDGYDPWERCSVGSPVLAVMGGGEMVVQTPEIVLRDRRTTMASNFLIGQSNSLWWDFGPVR